MLVRVIETLNSFKTKYGYWPSKLEAGAAAISELVTHHLTPLGFFLLQSKVDIVEGSDEKILAIGRNEDVLDYGNEGWAVEHQHDARAWLGLDEDSE